MNGITKLKKIGFPCGCVVSSGAMAEVLAPFDSPKYAVFPGFCDVHVHFREPGFSYKETIQSGSMASAAGGYTAVCTMPNLNPVPDSKENLQKQLDLRKYLVEAYLFRCG